MNGIKTLMKACFECNITPLLWGAHGIGKSQIIKQYAEENKMELVELRLGQLEPMDLIGLPEKTKDGKTMWLKPSWFPERGNGILFLDEINRGHPDVIQAIFQLVLDRQMFTHKLPDNWKVICAANYADSQYSVNDIDPALMDRFFHINLDFNKSSWLDWAKGKITSVKIVKLVEDDELSLSNYQKVELTTSPRSLEMLDKMISTSYIDEEHYPAVCEGLIAKKDINKVLDFLHGTNELMNILENLNKEEITKIVENKELDKIHKINDYVLRKIKFKDKLLDKEIINLAEYLMIIPVDITIGFMQKFNATNSMFFDRCIKHSKFVELRKEINKNVEPTTA